MHACSARFQCVVDSSHRSDELIRMIGATRRATGSARMRWVTNCGQENSYSPFCLLWYLWDPSLHLSAALRCYCPAYLYEIKKIHSNTRTTTFFPPPLHVIPRYDAVAFPVLCTKVTGGVWVIQRTTTARRLNTNTKHSVTYTYLGILATYAGTGYQLWALAPLLSPLFALVSFGWCAIAGLQAHNDDFLKRRDFATIEDCREY